MKITKQLEDMPNQIKIRVDALDDDNGWIKYKGTLADGSKATIRKTSKLSNLKAKKVYHLIKVKYKSNGILRYVHSYDTSNNYDQVR